MTENTSELLCVVRGGKELLTVVEVPVMFCILIMAVS